jgi:hypothetical protein
MSAWKQTTKRVFLVLAIGLLMPAAAQAAQSSSAHFQVNEVFIGSGGNLHSCGNQYCAKQSLGELAVGETCSSDFCAHGGFNTDRYAYIQFVVSNTNVDLGSLTASATKTLNATFSVKAYRAHGYSVINASDPPRNNSHLMQAISGLPTNSNAGTEQFGINLVANTSPVSFGADPQYVPDNTFSFGAVTTDYSQPDNYKYAKGDEIAYSNSSSSDTLYTISHIFNVSNVTPGGVYTMRHVLVATATY